MDAAGARLISATEDSPPEHRPRIVVGVDGSAGSRAALATAFTAGVRRGAALDVVATWPPVWTGGFPLDPPEQERVRSELAERTHRLTDEVRKELSGEGVAGVADVPVRFVISQGPPVTALLRAASDADLLVVGHRGHGAVRSAVLGSVALHCVTHARCPVVVAHPGPLEAETRRRVVVGVDGSEGSTRALAVAAEEAVLRGLELDVVAAYQPSDYRMDVTSVVTRSTDEIRTLVQRTTDEQVGEVMSARARGRLAAPTVRTHLIEGPAAAVLTEHAHGVDLLVVGCQGRGAVRGLLLGSVALRCAMNAECPVMVVHPAHRRSTLEPAHAESALVDS